MIREFQHDCASYVCFILKSLLFFDPDETFIFCAQGLYPESHGIIANYMYDAEMKMMYNMADSSKLDPRWYYGEPVGIIMMHMK